jgi:hypothetical protein
MLEKLDLISWEKLSRFRPDDDPDAANIPQTIRNLASSDRTTRQHAISALYEDLWHQGTVCETTVCVVPFLIELLAEPTIEDKSDIVQFLSAISFKSPFGYAHPAAVFFQSSPDRYVPPSWWDRDRDIDRVRSEVHKGYPIYQHLLLPQEKPFLRGAAAYLLGILTDCNDQNINWLRLCFTNEEDERVRAVIVLSVGFLSDDRSENTAWLQNIFETKTSLFSRINAAIGLARSVPDRVSDAVIDLLVDAIAAPDNLASMFDLYPWYFNSSLNSGILQYWCSIALNRIGRRSPRLLPTLINTLDLLSPEGSYEIAGCILNIIFDSKAMSPNLTVDLLSQEQRMGLDAIANSKQFWSEYSETCSVLHVDYMLQDFGIPTRPEKLRAFLAGELSLENHNESDDIPF